MENNAYSKTARSHGFVQNAATVAKSVLISHYVYIFYRITVIKLLYSLRP